jgi:uncharacterized protein (DUF952 family)
MAAPIYKICSASAWKDAESGGRFEGSADDRADGFIHFSAAHQLEGTAAKHFAGARDLLLIAVAPDRLGADLKWEPSRGGDLFPHLYAPLDLRHVLSVLPLPVGEDGRHCFPAGVLA